MRSGHCPGDLGRDPLILELLPMYRRWAGNDRRHLPFAGGIEEQPALLIEALLALDAEATQVLIENNLVDAPSPAR